MMNVRRKHLRHKPAFPMPSDLESFEKINGA
jgi:hypothetical protein